MRVDGARLKAARINSPTNLTQTEAAYIADIGERTLRRYEAKGGKMTRHTAKALAKAYGVTVKDITEDAT